MESLSIVIRRTNETPIEDAYEFLEEVITFLPTIGIEPIGGISTNLCYDSMFFAPFKTCITSIQFNGNMLTPANIIEITEHIMSTRDASGFTMDVGSAEIDEAKILRSIEPLILCNHLSSINIAAMHNPNYRRVREKLEKEFPQLDAYNP